MCVFISNFLSFFFFVKVGNLNLLIHIQSSHHIYNSRILLILPLKTLTTATADDALKHIFRVNKA